MRQNEQRLKLADVWQDNGLALWATPGPPHRKIELAQVISALVLPPPVPTEASG